MDGMTCARLAKSAIFDDNSRPEVPPAMAAGRKTKLNDEQRKQVVMRLAMYDRIIDIQCWLAEEFGLQINHQSIRHYDPTNGGRLAQEWVDLFNETRTAFLHEVAREPIANRAWRLRRLQEDYEATRAKDPDVARKMLEQAAKETSGFYQPRQGKHADTAPDAAPERERTPEEARNMLADRIGEALQRLPEGKVQKVSGSQSVQ